MIEPHRVAETAAFVASLPRTSVVVFVADKADACLVRDLRTSMHGINAAASTHVLVAPTEADEALLMRGRLDAQQAGLPIFREPIMMERRNVAAMSAAGGMADEPRVPRRDGAIFATAPREAVLSDQTRIGPQRCTKCGSGSPGWCKDMLCARRPTSADKLQHYLGDLGLTISPATVRPIAPAEVSLGAAPQILDLVEFGFTFSEASGLSDAERDLYAQLVRQRRLDALAGRH